MARRTDKSVVVVLLTTEEIEKVQPPKVRNIRGKSDLLGVLYTV